MNRRIFTRIIAFLIVFSLIFSVVSCKKADKGSVKVGYGKADITPTESVPLQGSGHIKMRMSNGFEEELYVCCVVVQDQSGNQVVLLTYDTCVIYPSMLAQVRNEVSSATGVPKENIMVSATHNHGGPNLGDSQEKSIGEYYSMLYKRTVKAAERAMADLSDAKMKTTSVVTENLTFVRRYIMEDGTFAGSNYGTFKKSQIKAHEDGLDEELQLIKFERKGSQDIILANFQAHAASTYPQNSVSSDFVGVYRRTIEEELGCHTIYFQGAAGNLNPMSKIESENIAADYVEHGKLLAQYVIDAEEDYKEATIGAIKFQTMNYKATVDHSGDSLIIKAQEVMNYWKETGNKEEADDLCIGTGISSANHAQGILNTASLGSTIDVELCVISIGNIAFATAPFELFGQLGLQIKEGSPYDMTFIMAYTNGSYGYLPSEDVWDHRGYEVDVCKLPKGDGEKLADQLIAMLKEL